ncbi:MAG: hypothetical protein R6W73_04085 [Candidatus Saliniplasma sp.]
MEMLSGCHICGKSTKRSCSICGLATCDEHLLEGVCAHCRKGKMNEQSEKKKIEYDEDDVYS